MHVLLYVCLAILLAIVVCNLKYIYKRATKPSFKNKIVLVTGGAMGIGKLMSKKLRKQGAIVVIWDINDAALSKMKQIGFWTYVVDVSNRAAVLECQKLVKQDVGIIDVLINNAGVVVGESLLNLREKDIRKTLEVNVLSHFWTCQAFLPDMVHRDSGHIVTISSMVAFGGVRGLTDYVASKFASRGFAESLRRELKGTNIKTTIAHPYMINTGMFKGAKGMGGLWKFFTSTLDPDYAAQEILNGIAMGQVRLLLPLRAFWLPSLCELSPWCLRDYLSKKAFYMEYGGIQDTRQQIMQPKVMIL